MSECPMGGCHYCQPAPLNFVLCAHCGGNAGQPGHSCDQGRAAAESQVAEFFDKYPAPRA